MNIKFLKWVLFQFKPRLKESLGLNGRIIQLVVVSFVMAGLATIMYKINLPLLQSQEENTWLFVLLGTIAFITKGAGQICGAICFVGIFVWVFYNTPDKTRREK